MIIESKNIKNINKYDMIIDKTHIKLKNLTLEIHSFIVIFFIIQNILNQHLE